MLFIKKYFLLNFFEVLRNSAPGIYKSRHSRSISSRVSERPFFDGSENEFIVLGVYTCQSS